MLNGAGVCDVCDEMTWSLMLMGLTVCSNLQVVLANKKQVTLLLLRHIQLRANPALVNYTIFQAEDPVLSTVQRFESVFRV